MSMKINRGLTLGAGLFLAGFGAVKFLPSSVHASSSGDCRVVSPRGPACTFLDYDARAAFASWSVEELPRSGEVLINITPPSSAGHVPYEVSFTIGDGYEEDCGAGCPGAGSPCCTAVQPPGGSSSCGYNDATGVASCIALDSNGVIEDAGSCNCNPVS
jgi:hypothetical protein